MKKILGLDLGTTSIGWAFINEAENENETSKIVKSGVRIVPLTTDEIGDFSKGNTISTNANRTLARGARRTLQRFKLRRKALIEIFKSRKLVGPEFKYAEVGENSTFSTYELRAKAALTQLTNDELLKVLLMINKKRGYKSSRKAKTEEEGFAIDGMSIAKELYENNLTPGQWVHAKIQNKNYFIPEFYRSDLVHELNRIISKQLNFYEDQLPQDLYDKIRDKNRTTTALFFTKELKIALSENKGTRAEKIEKLYQLRNNALKEKIDLEDFALIVSEINAQISSSSGYLGEISDRSKELYFNKQTVGQYLYEQVKSNPHARLKKQVFYRQDYLDEFDKIWEVQSQFNSSLTEELKREVRDITIFYQRKLKSQKHLISHCEFEPFHKTIPKSSPLFQEFRIWQNINNIQIEEKSTKEKFELDSEQKETLFGLLNIKENCSPKEVLNLFGWKDADYEINFTKLEGNRTRVEFIKALEKIFELEGYGLNWKTTPEIFESELKELIGHCGLDPNMLDFDSGTSGNGFDKQPYFQIWHLLYSAEEDNILKQNIIEKLQLNPNYASFFMNIKLHSDYGSLSARAIRKILPFLKTGSKYDVACNLAGYNHSKSLTKLENEQRELKSQIELLKKNALRNPVVEKILNQMINLVNAICNSSEMGRPDEIRIELARELKANSEQRKTMQSSIDKNTKENEEIKRTLENEFKIARVTKNDIIRYKLWKESNHISIYTGEHITASQLFSKEYDIEHIIPKSRLFDDSFSNKTLCKRNLNIDKSNQTAYSYLKEKLNEDEFAQFLSRVKDLKKNNKIGYVKYKKLLMTDDKIPTDFIERQLRETQYIAKKAKELLLLISRTVTSTSGSITDRLREDWGLIDVMQELNWEKYDKIGLTTIEIGKNGERLKKIKDWSKRNDHRHHAMDAITIAFTKPAYIQYLNNLNASSIKEGAIYGIETKYLKKDEYNKLRFKAPMEKMREKVKTELESIFISFKSKSKVVTLNKNKTKKKNGVNEKIQSTPRGQLHKETVYGQIHQYETKYEKIGANMDYQTIQRVANKKIREALLSRLNEFGGDPKVAFTGKNAPAKNLIKIESKLGPFTLDKVKTVQMIEGYTIRKSIAPDLKIDKVIDAGVREILKKRLNEFNGDSQKAFVNLDKNPIWLNKDAGICIKSVKITGVNNVEALHSKKDHLGQVILDENGQPIPNDFVSTGNNHHVAIYRDENGDLQEEVVSFYEAVQRKNAGLPIVKKQHEKGWEFVFTMKQNDYFVFPSTDFDPNEIDLTNPTNYPLISKNLFRVQKLTSKDYFFRHHLETSVENVVALKELTYKRLGLSGIAKCINVKIDNLGNLTVL